MANQKTNQQTDGQEGIHKEVTLTSNTRNFCSVCSSVRFHSWALHRKMLHQQNETSPHTHYSHQFTHLLTIYTNLLIYSNMAILACYERVAPQKHDFKKNQSEQTMVWVTNHKKIISKHPVSSFDCETISNKLFYSISTYHRIFPKSISRSIA